ncbi:MAG: hypothetical protein K2Z81_13740 [Cyanobacteria bacterium]|nr:hypothetical protein [Cyanobacteriota bacterium]
MTKFCKACHRTSERNPLGISDTATNCARDTFPVIDLAQEPLVGTTLDERWKIESCILPGSIHKVFLATDSSTGKTVLLQVLDGEKLKTELLNDFLAKWRQVSHRNVLPIYESGRLKDGRNIYIVSESPQSARTLAQQFDEVGTVSLQDALNISLQVIEALEALKANGIFFSNVIPTHTFTSATNTGHVIQLTNVSVIEELIEDPQASDLETRLTHNTPLYRGLESIFADCGNSNSIDERTVIYSLGCFMYDTITGLPPYVAKTLSEIAKRHVEEQPLSLRGVAPELNIPGLFDKLVLKALRPDPAKRQQTIAELRSDLLEAAKQSRLVANVGTTEYQTRLYTGETTNMAPVREEDIAAIEQAKAEKEAKEAKEAEEQLPPETRAELEKKIQDLRNYVYSLTGLLVAGLLAFIFFLSNEGCDENRAPLWKKFSWDSQMSQAGDAFKKKNFDAAKSGYQAALMQAKDFQDGGERQEKSLQGLLKVADATNDAAAAKSIHSQIVALDADKLSQLFERASQDARQIDMNLTIPLGAMTQEMAEEYADKFIAKARDYMKQGQTKKAESFLRKALEVETRWKDSSGKASSFASELARECKSGEQLANLTTLLEQVLATQKGGDKAKRMNTLLSLALVHARGGKFDEAEKSLDEALKLSQGLSGSDKADITAIVQEYTSLVSAANQAHRAKKYAGTK